MDIKDYSKLSKLLVDFYKGEDDPVVKESILVVLTAIDSTLFNDYGIEVHHQFDV